VTGYPIGGARWSNGTPAVIMEAHCDLLPNFRTIAGAVERLLEIVNYAAYRAAAERQHNRAVFEIPDIRPRILDRHS
jgi:hypothetical protein